MGSPSWLLVAGAIASPAACGFWAFRAYRAGRMLEANSFAFLGAFNAVALIIMGVQALAS